MRSPERSNLIRTASSASSSPRRKIPQRETPSPRTEPLIQGSVHVAPRESFDDPVSPKSQSNPFEGRLFDADTGPIVSEDHHEFDEVTFNSPIIGAGRGSGPGQFHFQDHEDDDEDLYDDATTDVESETKNGKYTNVRVAEDHGLEEGDTFLDEKRKVSLTSLGSAQKNMKRSLTGFSPRRIVANYRRLREKYPRWTKWGLIVLASIIPLFLFAFIILVIIAVVAFHSPTLYAPNALGTSHLTAGAWGFNFTRAVNMTMINRSPMAIAVNSIDVNIDLARGTGNFMVHLTSLHVLIAGQRKHTVGLFARS